MVRSLALVVAGALLVAHAPLAKAQHSVATPAASAARMDPALAASARITLDSARAIARAAVPHARIASEELEREHGRLIYSFDMKVAKRAGIQEVNVSAITGAVIGVHHESAAAERREQRAESQAGKVDSSRNVAP